MTIEKAKHDVEAVDTAIKAATRYACGLDRPDWHERDGLIENFFLSPDGQDYDLFLRLRGMGYSEGKYRAPYAWSLTKDGIAIDYTEGDVYIRPVDL